MTRVQGQRRGSTAVGTAVGTVATALTALTALTMAVALGSTSAAAAATGTGTTPRVPRTAPSGVAFYRAPTPLPPGQPGDIIWATPFRAVAGAKAWKVLYHSTAVDGKDIAVSGVIVVPDGKAPAGGRPVVSWAHGTHGIADSCAPSRTDKMVSLLPAITKLVQQGYVVTATDYEGLGTPGVHPYLVGESEAHGVLDIARAAQRLPGSGANAKTVVWGQSQGGQATLFAGEVAPTYAPDLELAGVVSGAPVTDVATMFPAAATIPDTLGFAVMGMIGMQAAYPEAHVADVLTPAALAQSSIVEKKCYEDVLAAYKKPVDQVIARNPSEVSPFPQIFANDSPGRVATPAPMFVYQGKSDDVVYQVFTDAYVKKACGLGDTVDYQTFGGKDHYAENDAAESQVLAWIRDRFSGAPASSSCASLTPAG